jgi:tetratricopeptide (TPR) repeat protein
MQKLAPPDTKSGDLENSMMSLRISKDLPRRPATSGCPLAPLATLGQKVTKSLPRHFAPLTLLALIICLASTAPAYPQQSGVATNDLLAQANAAELARDFPRAAECYATYLKDHSDSADVWQRLGLVYYLDNRYDHAAPALQRAVELNPSLWGANLFLGISEYRMAQFVRAQESVQAALKVNPDLPEGHLWMGSILMALGQREAATAELEKIPAASSVAMDANYLLVQGYRSVAEDYYRKIQQSDANSYRAHQLAAESFAWDGKYQNAILEYRKALQLKPDLEGAHRGIAEMYWEQRQFEKATQEYVVELQKFPLDDEAHLRIGEYLLSQGKVGEAVPQLETALQVNKRSWELDRALGQASMATGDMAKAQSWLESATQQNPSDALSHQLLAESYRATGQTDRSQREQTIFIKLSAAERN